MKITIEFRGVEYTTTIAEDAGLLVQRIEHALAAGRDPAELLVSAAISGVLAWDNNPGLQGALKNSIDFLKLALEGGCGISRLQFQSTGRAIDEFERVFGKEAVKNLRVLHEKVGAKIVALRT